MCLKYNFSITATHIPGKENCIADAISRLFTPGYIQKVLSLLANWWMLHPLPSAFWLPFHMSNAAIHFLSPHIVSGRLCTQTGAGRGSEVECSLMVWWVVGSILHGVDPLSYFSFQPVLHNWCNKGCGLWYVLSCLWDGVYKRTLAVN